MDITVERILKELKRQGKKQTDLAEFIGITSNVITDWKSGRIRSYSKYIHGIAQFLGVSVEYLRGETDVLKGPIKKEKPLPDIMYRFYELSDDSQKEVISFMEFKLSQNV